MSLQDLGSLASIANTMGVVSLLLLALRLIDSGRWVRGADLTKCERRVAQLERRLERAGFSSAHDDDEDELVLNGGSDAGHSRGP